MASHQPLSSPTALGLAQPHEVPFSSSRREAKTSRKRYEEDDVDFEPELDLDGGDALLPASTRRASAVVLKAVEAAPDASISDDEGDALLRTTEHIWTLPVQSYLLQQSIKRQKLARDFGANEQSRHYLIACRVLEMSERRQGEMREAKTRRMVDGVLVEEGRLHELQLESSKAEREEEKRLAKEREREERLRKQREGARKRREEERLKKDHDDEHRRVRAEEARLAKQLEVQRRALLNPEQRAAEDAIAQEKAQRDREARAARTLEDDLLGISEGRGARKKRRTEGGDGLEGDRAGYDDGTGEYDGEYDEMDDFGDIYGSPGPSGRVKGKATPRRAYEGAEYYAGAYEQFGAYQQQPYTPPTSPHQSGYGSLLDDTPLPSDHEMDENLRRLELPSSLSDPTERAAAVEALERKLWTQIARRDIPKAARLANQSTTSRHLFAKRLSGLVAREARRATVRTKGAKDVQTRAKRVMRELLLFMKGNEKKERESRKKAEKDAFEKVKKEEDLREAKRAARKLNFLITQTELYSHFIGDKVKTSEAEESADTAGSAPAIAPQKSAALLAAIAAGDTPADAELKELDFDIDDEANAAQHARRNAQAAINAAKQAASAFDAAAANGVASSAKAAAPLDFDTDELNFQNPSGMNGDVQVKQPKLLTCTLKDYQLKGLNWLANLYEQGINGILADEMGLGKTVQSISLMAYLAEVHDIWGPFLVIAPASTLHNWQQEISRFVPGLKALPYWGNTKDRTILRKFWNRKSARYDRDAPFHILVTSYQLVVQDEKYFQGVKWQYMVLDEAQAIKSSTSMRWKTLLSFKCRNRLLLTGTPIQNSMHELWALLHFIMPSLFDNHDEFSEWFSRDIEGNVGDKKGEMNEGQLRRLHMILKPFMLRRIKKNVQNELGDKIEIDLFCDLTPRQKYMYRTLRENMSISDLVNRASTLSSDDASVKRLMNLIMQFRKVCNHPELFERADVSAPLAWVDYNFTGNLVRDPEVLEVRYATRSTIEYVVPKVVYRDAVDVPGAPTHKGSDSLYLDRLLNIWTPDHIHHSIQEDSVFSFAPLLELSPADLSRESRAGGFQSVGRALARQNAAISRANVASIIPSKSSLIVDPVLPSGSSGLTALHEVHSTFRDHSRLSRVDARFYIDKVVAPSIEAVCADRAFMTSQQDLRFDPAFFAPLLGLPVNAENARRDMDMFTSTFPGLSPAGALTISPPPLLPFPRMSVPPLRTLILDSGKLVQLDKLLPVLKAQGHRVLLYFQMTRMIDLMEEYLGFRQYKYLRLDGGSSISERRDMVGDWQTKPELFIFLLSTRAGGLGINLTAADTVIFYDSDWNPSNDAQAMDRAHRLGQTKQVTVYRLITKDTVDERIVQLARNKKLVQDAVVGSSSATLPSLSRTNELSSLLLSQEDLEASVTQNADRRRKAELKAVEDGRKGAVVRRERKEEAEELERGKREREGRMGGRSGWEDDQDAFDFFTTPTATTVDPQDEDDLPSTTPNTPKRTTPAPPALGPDGLPVKKKRRTAAEMIGPDGKKLPRIRGPRKKK